MLNSLKLTTKLLSFGVLFIWKSATAIEATYHLIEDGNTALLAIDANSQFEPIVIVADCTSSNRTYSFKQYDKEADKFSSFPQFLIYANGKHYYKGRSVNEKALIEISDSLEIRKPQLSATLPPRLPIESIQVSGLINLCKNKYKSLISKATSQAKQTANERENLINKVRSIHNIEPMFNGENQIRVDDLVTEFLNHGYSEKVGKFVWFYDGTYRVDQVLEGGVILKSNSYTGLLPITIFTEKKALENQRWSVVSGSPLKFIGVDNYDTVIGTKQQTLVFEHLWKNKQP